MRYVESDEKCIASPGAHLSRQGAEREPGRVCAGAIDRDGQSIILRQRAELAGPYFIAVEVILADERVASS